MKIILKVNAFFSWFVAAMCIYAIMYHAEYHNVYGVGIYSVIFLCLMAGGCAAWNKAEAKGVNNHEES